MKNFAIVSLLSLVATAAWSGQEHHHQAPVMPKEFDVMKKLVGTWEGTSKMGDKEHPVTVVYELTSGDTVVTEKMMPGTPHAMISVYHKDGKSLGMTHYRALGNRPEMTLKKADDKTLVFEVSKNQGIESPKENHMHGVTLSLPDADTLKQDWVEYENGKQKGVSSFVLKRKKTS